MTYNDDTDTPIVDLEHPEEIDWIAKGRQEADVSAAEARREYTYQKTKELLQAAGVSVDAEASAADVDAAHSDLRHAVNMTAADLQVWGTTTAVTLRR